MDSDQLTRGTRKPSQGILNLKKAIDRQQQTIAALRSRGQVTRDAERELLRFEQTLAMIQDASPTKDL